MADLIQKEIHITPGDLCKGFNVQPGYRYRFVLHQNESKVDVVEAEDLLFRTDSALFLPFAVPKEDSAQTDDSPFESQDDPMDEQVRVSGLAVIGGLFRYYQLCMDRGDAKYLLVCGHTDTVGKESYNEELSQMRSDVVVSIILGDTQSRSTFVTIVNQKHTDEDVQHVLVWMSKMLGVPGAHPGTIDGKIGQNTKSAILEIKRYLRSGEFPPPQYPHSIFHSDIDNIRHQLENTTYFGANLWTMVFELYQAELAASLKHDGFMLPSIRAALKWVDPEKKATGCGETWPIDSRGKDNYKSQSNRRVEILIYDVNEITGKLPCKKEKCAEEDCHIFKNIDRYNPGATETKLKWEYVPLPGPDGKVHFNLIIRFDSNEDTVGNQNDVYELRSSADNIIIASLSPISDKKTDEIGCFLEFNDCETDFYYTLTRNQIDSETKTAVFENLSISPNHFLRPKSNQRKMLEWRNQNSIDAECLLNQRLKD